MTTRGTPTHDWPIARRLQPEWRGLWRLYGLLASLAFAVVLSGCVDGPLYNLKKVNPFFQKEFNKDRALGATFEDRLQELTLLESQLAGMELQQQQAWARQLETLATRDASPEMRARATKVIATLPFEEAVRALNTASTDDSEKVRLAACAAWKRRGDAEGRKMLMSLTVRSDETTSVRQAAIDALSVYDDAEVRAQMASLLDDSSPAVQYQVAQSLKTMTGRDYGGDFESWKQYLAGNDVPPPAPKSLTATIWESLPSPRR